jgi:flagellar motor switch protein FliN/FliY
MADTEKLQALGALAAQDMGQTLNSLLGREIQVHFSHVEDMSPEVMTPTLSGSYFVSVLEASGGLNGAGLLLTKEKDASIIADLLIGQDGTSAPEKMTELHLSAFGEVIQQLAEALSQAIQKANFSKTTFQVREMNAQETATLATSLGQLGGMLTVFSFGLYVQDLFSGDLYFCLPEAVANHLAIGGKPAASAPTGSFQQGVPPKAAPTRVGGSAMQQQTENEFSGSARTGGNIALLMDVPLKLTVELGRTTKLVKEILALAPGSVVELDKLAGEAVDILVNEKLIAKGEVVVIDENFGVRITEIINPEERLNAVQA